MTDATGTLRWHGRPGPLRRWLLMRELRALLRALSWCRPMLDTVAVTAADGVGVALTLDLATEVRGPYRLDAVVSLPSDGSVEESLF